METVSGAAVLERKRLSTAQPLAMYWTRAVAVGES